LNWCFIELSLERHSHKPGSSKIHTESLSTKQVQCTQLLTSERMDCCIGDHVVPYQCRCFFTP